ncbi:MAG: DUF58 domain-containing protein, partial [Anaerolineales bacterium]
MTIAYIIIGGFGIGLWWANKALTQVETKRHFNTHAFLGEKIKIILHIKNKSWLPLPWLEVRDSLPVALTGAASFQTVTNLMSRADANFEYSVDASKRGYYPIGPLSISTGDILGLSETLLAEKQAEHVIIYPKIIPFTSVEIPSYSPHGTLRHSLPLFEDPTRVFGKREYMSGDSLRRIDWKSSASSGRLQVRLFEPSIALETFVILNLNAEDYFYRTRVDSTELAIVVAASISNWVIGKKQTVGMLVNGRDPWAAAYKAQSIPLRKGKLHLMRMLETLARVETIDDSTLVPLIQEQRHQLARGTTLIVITGQASDDLLDELHQARRRGQNALLILVGNVTDETIIRRAGILDVPVFSIMTESDLKIWMQ